MRIEAALIGAGNRGLRTYGRYAELYPHELGFVAVAEPDPVRRQGFAEIHGIPEAGRWESWQDLLDRDRVCGAVFICTQDRMHYGPTLAALERGYHVMLEKPMSQDAWECIHMARKAEETGRILVIGHVLRYAPFFSTLKQIVGSGRIGEIVSIQYNENIGYWHFAHSFVRGNWRKTADASPMILAKSCHDMDILAWLVDGRKCLRICSFGSLRHFRTENAPAGSTDRCTQGCAVERDCPYSALKLYLRAPGGPWTARGYHPVTLQTLENLKRIASPDADPDAVLRELETGRYGRCVYHCDNDVVDHQVVSLEFDGGVSASFVVCGHTAEWLRTIKIMGTRGEVRGHQGKDEIEVLDFRSGSREVIETAAGHGHGGGDERLIADFLNRIGSPREDAPLTSAALSVQSHLMAMAAERSRLEGRTVDMEDFVREAEREGSERSGGGRKRRP